MLKDDNYSLLLVWNSYVIGVVNELKKEVNKKDILVLAPDY